MKGKYYLSVTLLLSLLICFIQFCNIETIETKENDTDEQPLVMLEFYSASGTRKCKNTTYHNTFNFPTTTTLDSTNTSSSTTITENMNRNPSPIEVTCDYNIIWQTNFDAVCSVYMGHKTTGLELVESDIRSEYSHDNMYNYEFSKSYYSYGNNEYYYLDCYKSVFRVECEVLSSGKTAKTENVYFREMNN